VVCSLRMRFIVDHVCKKRRNCQTLAHLYDERNEAVLKMISTVIATANSMGKYIGICGQAPSDFPEFAERICNDGVCFLCVTP